MSENLIYTYLLYTILSALVWISVFRVELCLLSFVYKIMNCIHNSMFHLLMSGLLLTWCFALLCEFLFFIPYTLHTLYLHHKTLHKTWLTIDPVNELDWCERLKLNCCQSSTIFLSSRFPVLVKKAVLNFLEHFQEGCL